MMSITPLSLVRTQPPRPRFGAEPPQPPEKKLTAEASANKNQEINLTEIIDKRIRPPVEKVNALLTRTIDKVMDIVFGRFGKYIVTIGSMVAIKGVVGHVSHEISHITHTGSADSSAASSHAPSFAQAHDTTSPFTVLHQHGIEPYVPTSDGHQTAETVIDKSADIGFPPLIARGMSAARRSDTVQAVSEAVHNGVNWVRSTFGLDKNAWALSPIFDHLAKQGVTIEQKVRRVRDLKDLQALCTVVNTLVSQKPELLDNPKVAKYTFYINEWTRLLTEIDHYKPKRFNDLRPIDNEKFLKLVTRMLNDREEDSVHTAGRSIGATLGIPEVTMSFVRNCDIDFTEPKK